MQQAPKQTYQGALMWFQVYIAAQAVTYITSIEGLQNIVHV